MAGAVLAIDQGTTNSKAVLVSADGDVLAMGSAPVGLSTPQPGWVEQDAEDLWQSVLRAISSCLAAADRGRDRRDSAVDPTGVRRGMETRGRAVGPVIGWQDVRTAAWCS